MSSFQGPLHSGNAAAAAAAAGSNDDDTFRISPNIFVGVFALALSFVAYIISSTSLGKRSISHAWLFSGLLVLNPSEKSLRHLGVGADHEATTTHSSATTPRRKNPTIKNVSGLELVCKSILPGAVPLSVMTAKERGSFLQWQALDAAVCIFLACLVATASPFFLAWYTVYQEGTVCCGDLNCWLHWWREQLGGPGLIYTSSPPPNLMLLLLGGIAIWFWWRLVIHATRLPGRSVFRFSPFSYINGWLMLFATLFLLHLTSDTTNNSIGRNISFLGIPLNDALEEWSARVTLWIGLTGFYSPGNEAARERVLVNIFQSTQLLFAATTGLIAFAVADPLRETMRVYFGNAFGDQINVVDAKSGKFMRLIQRTQLQCSMLSVASSPVLCLGSYLVPETALRGFFPRTVRAGLAWSFIWTMAIVVRPLLRKHLLQVMAEVDLIFDTIKKPSSEDILSPFQNRSKRLLSMGGQLLVFPAFVLMILTLGHGAGQQPTAVSDANTFTTGIYPFAFHQSLWTADEEQKYQEWEEFQAKASAQRSFDDASILADLSTTRANIGLCPNNTSFSFLGGPISEFAVDEHSSRNLHAYSSPIYRVSKSSELITSQLFTKTTFVRVLRKLQHLAKEARSDPTAATATPKQTKTEANKDLKLEKETQEAQQDFHSFLQALAFHPLLTSTVVLPVLDFIGLILNYLWIVYFAYFGLESWTRRHRRRRYKLLIKGEKCKVVRL